MITGVEPLADGRVRVVGCSADDGRVKTVRVNGVEATPLVPDFSRWEAIIGASPGHGALTSTAEDAAGHVESTTHALVISGGSKHDNVTEPRPRHGH